MRSRAAVEVDALRPALRLEVVGVDAGPYPGTVVKMAPESCVYADVAPGMRRVRAITLRTTSLCSRMAEPQRGRGAHRPSDRCHRRAVVTKARVPSASRVPKRTLRNLAQPLEAYKKDTGQVGKVAGLGPLVPCTGLTDISHNDASAHRHPLETCQIERLAERPGPSPLPGRRAQRNDGLPQQQHGAALRTVRANHARLATRPQNLAQAGVTPITSLLSISYILGQALGTRNLTRDSGSDKVPVCPWRPRCDP